MAILKILHDDDPSLRKISKEVDKITPRILRLLDDMRQTLDDASGAGLAAPQVGVLRRVALVVDEEGNTVELINPQIISSSDERQNEVEGCLSIPDVWGVTDRPMTVTVKATDREGKDFTVTGTGFTARAFCHEIDHLDGILFTDKALRLLDEDELRELREEKE